MWWNILPAKDLKTPVKGRGHLALLGVCEHDRTPGSEHRVHVTRRSTSSGIPPFVLQNLQAVSPLFREPAKDKQSLTAHGQRYSVRRFHGYDVNGISAERSSHFHFFTGQLLRFALVA